MAVTEVFESSPEEKKNGPGKSRGSRPRRGGSGSRPGPRSTPPEKKSPGPRSTSPERKSPGSRAKSPRRTSPRKKEEAREVKSPLPVVKKSVWPVKVPEKVMKVLKPLLHFRENLFSGSLKKSLNIPLPLTISWQPLWWIGVKTALLLWIYTFFYGFYPVVAGWMKDGLTFFRLADIYKFEFPGTETFLSISRYLFLGLIFYSAVFFVLPLWQGLFSSLGVSRKTGHLYYSSNLLFRRQLYVISIGEMDSISLIQNPLFRLLNMGTLVIHRKSGEKITIRAVKRVSRVMKDISLIKNS